MPLQWPPAGLSRPPSDCGSLVRTRPGWSPGAGSKQAVHRSRRGGQAGSGERPLLLGAGVECPRAQATWARGPWGLGWAWGWEGWGLRPRFRLVPSAGCHYHLVGTNASVHGGEAQPSSVILAPHPVCGHHPLPQGCPSHDCCPRDSVGTGLKAWSPDLCPLQPGDDLITLKDKLGDYSDVHSHLSEFFSLAFCCL